MATTTITAKDVQELRQRTGAGMMECKKALEEANGDMEKAIDNLRKKGVAKAERRVGRQTGEGQIGSYIHHNGKLGVMVEVNCETDFVARTDDFKGLVKHLAEHIAAAAPVAVDKDSVPADVVERERRIFEEEVRQSGKPENLIAKIVEGKVEAYYKDVALLHQAWVREVVEGSVELGLEVLSLFAFSQENWHRPPTEITALMSLLEEYIAREADELEERGIRVKVLGALERLTPPAAAAVDRVVRQTAHGDRMTLNLFISYSGRDELVRAARQLAADAAQGRIDPSQIDEEEFRMRLYTADCPDPDLLIRTSGERRISNFLLWQVAYSELYISPVLWPDFSRRDLFEAIRDFQTRERRFGRVSA